MKVPSSQPVTPAEGFVVAQLSGDPYEIGLQHGRLLAERIQQMRRTLYQDLIYRQGRVFGVGFTLLCRAITAIMERHIQPELRQEMRGVADGAGVGYRDVLLFNCFDDLLHALVRLVLLLVPPPLRARVGLACSCFVALGERTTSGHMLLGRNLDYYVVDGVLGADGIVTRTMQEQLVCFVIRPSRGHAFVSIGWPGCVGVVTGLNARGLALACLTSAVPGQTPNGTPLPMLYRALLQRHDTLEAVEWGLRKSRRTIGNNLLVASARDRSAALFEFTPWQVRRVDPQDGRLTTTNHFQTPELIPSQNGWVIPNSRQRLKRLSALCALEGPLDVAQAQRALLDTTPPPDGQADQFDCLYNPGTIYSAVLAPEELRLWLRATDRPGRPFVELDVAEALGSSRPAAVA